MSAARLADVTGAGRPWGLLAEFDSVDALLPAVENLRAAGYTKFDVHSPFPVHGVDAAMGTRMSRLPWLVAAGGAAGTATALVMQWWMNGVDYPFKISAKPLFGLPAAIPITFELTVLFAALTAFVAVIAANGLPQLFHPLFANERFRRGTSDRFFISVESADPLFELPKTRALLETLGSVHVDEVEG